MLTQKFISSFLAPLPVVWPVAWHDVDSFSVAFWFLFSFLPWRTYEHLSSVSIWTQLLGCLIFVYFFLFIWFSFSLGPGWVEWGCFSFACVDFYYLFIYFISFTLVSFLIIRRPSLQARIETLLPFLPHLVPHELLVVGKFKVLLFIKFVFIFSSFFVPHGF